MLLKLLTASFLLSAAAATPTRVQQYRWNGAVTPVATIYPSGTQVKVSGYRDERNGLDLYFGVPYAAAPTGSLRLKAPQSYEWSGDSYNATEVQPACMQPPGGAGPAGMSEDCLFLNVWVPTGFIGQPIPVLAYIHGGSFDSGRGDDHNVTAFLRQGIQSGKPIIFVSINYRLGPFGFGYGQPYLSNQANNVGMLDIIASLQWIPEYIPSFGGDSSKVRTIHGVGLEQITVVGTSAGAVATGLLMLVPGVPPLHGLIMNSGSASANPLAPAVDGFPHIYPQLLNLTGCMGTESDLWSASANQTSFECLLGLDADVLNNATTILTANPENREGFPWNPNVDYVVLPDRPHRMLQAGNFTRIPLIATDDKDEGTIFVLNSNTTGEVIEQILWQEPVAPSEWAINRLLELYPDNPSDGSPYGTGNQSFGYPQYKRSAALYGDLGFQSSRRWLLEQTNAHGWNQTWTSLFDGVAPEPNTGVTHTLDLNFFFDDITADSYSAGSPGEAGVELAHKMAQYWLNFIHDANPNCDSLLYWPTYHEGGQSANMLRPHATNTSYGFDIIQDDYRKEGIAFINAHPIDFNS